MQLQVRGQANLRLRAKLKEVNEWMSPDTTPGDPEAEAETM
jgi:hypothetical protein